MIWLIREYQDDDFESAIRLLEASASGKATIFSLGECIVALRSRQAAVVATMGAALVGLGVATVAGDRAWVITLAIREDLRGQGMASGLLLALERQLAAARVRRIGFVLPHEELMADGLRRAGYEMKPAIAYFEKLLALEPGQAAILDVLGGEVIDPKSWDRLLGMRAEKGIIERRVIAPLSNADLAAQHGVVPPRAVLLFGPPGTGKTSFARGVASRLGWPFVELLPSRLADGDTGLATGLRDAFTLISRLDRVVVFVDEIEEIAAARQGPGLGHLHGVTNELLKVIPAFRARANRLLIAATNAVDSLDPAVLRPGRMDYVIPIGAPDEDARRELWTSHAGASGVEIDALVTASESLTTAEIQHAAHAASQSSFERALQGGAGRPSPGPTTEDFMTAIGAIRPSLVSSVQEAFKRDTNAYARF